MRRAIIVLSRMAVGGSRVTNDAKRKKTIKTIRLTGTSGETPSFVRFLARNTGARRFLSVAFSLVQRKSQNVNPTKYCDRITGPNGYNANICKYSFEHKKRSGCYFLICPQTPLFRPFVLSRFFRCNRGYWRSHQLGRAVR